MGRAPKGLNLGYLDAAQEETDAYLEIHTDVKQYDRWMCSRDRQKQRGNAKLGKKLSSTD